MKGPRPGVVATGSVSGVVSSHPEVKLTCDHPIAVVANLDFSFALLHESVELREETAVLPPGLRMFRFDLTHPFGFSATKSLHEPEVDPGGLSLLTVQLRFGIGSQSCRHQRLP